MTNTTFQFRHAALPRGGEYKAYGSPRAQRFRGELAQIGALQRVVEHLQIHQRFSLPKGAHGSRQTELLAVEGDIRRRFLDPALTRLADEVADEVGEQEAPQVRANLELFYAQRHRLERVPLELVEEITQAETAAFLASDEAIRFNRFDGLVGPLRRVIDALRRKAERLDSSRHPYEVLLDAEGHGLSLNEVRAHAVTLTRGLLEIKAAARGKDAGFDLRSLDAEIPLEKQHAFYENLARAMGFDFERGWMGALTSGMSQTSDADPAWMQIRLRYDERSVLRALRIAVKMIGYCLYHQGADPDFLGQPVGRPVSQTFLEGHGFFWERHIGLSEPFLDFIAERLQESFGSAMPSATGAELYAALTRLDPLRVKRYEMDEVHYGLQMLLRLPIEVELFEGTLDPKDLVDRWNGDLARHFGIRPTNLEEGILVDRHWIYGYFGRFPTYALGEVIASQLDTAVRADLPHLDDDLRAGRFAPLRGWFQDRLYRWGSLVSEATLLKEVTGGGFDPAVHLDYLWRKYV